MTDTTQAYADAIAKIEAARATYRAVNGTASREQEDAFLDALAAFRQASHEYELALALGRAEDKADPRRFTGERISAMGSFDELDGK